jgi:dipeptidyl aminopeptidase/acylaminoacyl peptidase
MLLKIATRALAVLVLSFALTPAALSQQRQPAPPVDPVQERLRALEEALSFLQQSLTKDIDDLMWMRALDDVAVVDKVRYAGPPPRVNPNPTAQGAGNPVIITAYTFIPRKYVAAGKLPLLVYVHGGVHGNFESSAVHMVREMVEQGYAVIAPDYRGSTGYGQQFWRLIDYGGLENDDVLAGKQWMIENYANIDPERVGIIGWSTRRNDHVDEHL